MKIILYLATNYSNSGDKFIVERLIDELIKYSHVILDSSACGNAYARSLSPGCKIVKFNIISRLFFILKLRFSKVKIGLVLVPGASKIPRRYVDIYRLKFSILYLRLCKACGAGIYTFGRSINDPDLDPYARDYLNAILQVLDYAGLRSREIVDNFKIQNPLFKNLHYCPDLAYLYQKATLLKPPLTCTKAVLSFRQNLGNKELISVDDVVALSNFLRDAGISDFVLCAQVDEDCEFMKSIFERMQRSRFSVRMFPETLTAEQSMEIYSNADVVFSNRLHVLLFSILSGIPCISVGKKKMLDKIQQVFTSVGLGFANINLENPGKIYHEFTNICKLYQLNKNAINLSIAQECDLCSRQFLDSFGKIKN